jgi:hypothetical protein
MFCCLLCCRGQGADGAQAHGLEPGVYVVAGGQGAHTVWLRLGGNSQDARYRFNSAAVAATPCLCGVDITGSSDTGHAWDRRRCQHLLLQVFIPLLPWLQVKDLECTTDAMRLTNSSLPQVLMQSCCCDVPAAVPAAAAVLSYR